jgi:hypothetical protein
MDRDTVLRDATIVVRDGRISAIGTAARVTVPRDARRIDGRGKWVIPASPTCTYTSVPTNGYGLGRAVLLGVYLAQGVTTARP